MPRRLCLFGLTAVLILFACGGAPRTAPASAGSRTRTPKNDKSVSPVEQPTDTTRRPAIASSDPAYARVEGTSFKNECKSDNDCFTAGCSSEICSAEQGAASTCEMPVNGWPSAGASCGCVGGQCIWYRSTTEGKTTPTQAMKCDDGVCAPGLTCVKYYGIAGPNGPMFTSCEIPCPTADATCPPRQNCITIADGPGRVCRPLENASPP